MSSGHPHMFTYVYIYILNPTALPLSPHSSAATAAAATTAATAAAAALEKEMQACAIVPTKGVLPSLG